MGIKIDASFTAMIAFKIKVESDLDEHTIKSKIRKKFDPDTDVGIDFYLVGHQHSCSSDLYR